MKLLQGPKGTLVLFDYIVSLLAIIGNCLVLESVVKVHFDLTGYRRFLISLAVSDLYICGVNLLTFIHATVATYSTNPQMEKCGADFLRSLQFVGFFANLLNLCGMSVDHFIGIVYPLRYCDLMNKKVTRIAVVAIWVTSFVLGFADFPIATAVYLTNHYEPATVTSSDFNFPGPSNNDFNFGNGLNFGALADFGSSDFSNTTGLDTADLLKGPLLAKGMDPNSGTAAFNFGANFGDETSQTESTQHPFAFIENISGISSEELFASLDQSGNVISDITSMINATSGSGSGEENVEKTLYEEILKIVQHKKENVDWCTFYLSNKVWLEFSVMTLTLACFIFLIICYGRIFKEVFVNIDPSERNTRKLVITTFLLLGAFTVCWLPFMIFEFSMIIVLRSDTDSNNTRTLAGSASFLIIHNVFNSLLMCYPLLDPVIYAARMRIVRRYILTQYGRFFPCCRDYIQRVTARRTSVFTYSLTSQQYTNVPASKTNSMASAINGTASNTYNNARLGLLNSNEIPRYSISESAFNSKRESVSASNVSVNETGAESWQEEQPYYTINSTMLSSSLHPNANRSSSNSLSPNASLLNNTTSVNSSRLPPSLEESLPPSFQCPPLIYRRGGSFKRQIRDMFAQKQQQSSVVKSPARKVTSEVAVQHQHTLKVCYETKTGRSTSSVDEDDYETSKISIQTPLESTPKAVSKFNPPRLKSRSSYQIPLCFEEDVTPSNSTASGGVSTASSSVPEGPDDSSTRLLPDHENCCDSDIEEEQSPLLQPNQPPGYAILRRPRCPCSEFANSQAVVDKFRDNSLRLLGVGTLGPDHSSNSSSTCCNNTAPTSNHQRGSSDNGHEAPIFETNAPVVRSFVGKSPTVGDFSSPNDDLSQQHINNRNNHRNHNNNYLSERY